MNQRRTAWRRRQFLRATGASAGLLVTPSVALAAGDCTATPSTEDGPLYPATDIPWTHDLTRVPGRSGRATGQVVYLFGEVMDVACQPVADATVEIWQADHRGYYKHPRHSAPLGLDPFFGYFGRVRADHLGRYRLTTIVPSWYRIFDIERAAHIHIKVRSPQNGVFTSEVYFAGDDQDSKRATDPVFQSRRNKEQLIIDTASAVADFGRDVPREDGAAYCRFDVAYRL
ncbi:MAG: intradiol ring-cleavage dioxygenase [Pseudomonadota bacterium]